MKMVNKEHKRISGILTGSDVFREILPHLGRSKKKGSISFEEFYKQLREFDRFNGISEYDARKLYREYNQEQQGKEATKSDYEKALEESRRERESQSINDNKNPVESLEQKLTKPNDFSDIEIIEEGDGVTVRVSAVGYEGSSEKKKCKEYSENRFLGFAIKYGLIEEADFKELKPVYEPILVLLESRLLGEQLEEFTPKESDDIKNGGDSDDGSSVYFESEKKPEEEFDVEEKDSKKEVVTQDSREKYLENYFK